MCFSLKKWVTGTNFFVYVSHFLTAWGDRMWAFGIGLFLVNIAPGNLQLPAVYGLAGSVAIFFLGPLVGQWVDHTPRLKAAQLSLILQNLLVVICVVGVYTYLWFEVEIKQDYGRWLMDLSHAAIIILGILANLASLARMISVERDWIVEICGKDKDKLATMTSSLRRIDQATLILAPIATGQIMSYAGLKNGAIFIAAWNVVSVFLEYYLMWKVYNTVSALRAKRAMSHAEESPAIEAEEEMAGAKEAETQNSALSENLSSSQEVDNMNSSSPDMQPLASASGEAESMMREIQPESEKRKEDDAAVKAVVSVKDDKKEKECGCGKMVVCSRFVALYRGWRTYMGYSVALAGLALACLYMTVLGFDNITVAYAVTQGVSESILGILMGVSAVFGILGTFAYPAMRRRLGLVRTGIFALSLQVSCLVLCVVSVWMPGSPFDPLYYISPQRQHHRCFNVSMEQPLMPPTSSNFTKSAYNVSMSATLPPAVNSTDVVVTYNVSMSATLPTAVNSTDVVVTVCEVDSYISVGMLIGGIVLARFGLWIADLTITQLFLEVVEEGERGVVSGVQSSCNKLMDVLKFVLVVAVPDIPVFGYLVIISFLFICLGWLLYAIFLRRERGHFFHKCQSGCVTTNGHVIGNVAAAV